MRAKFVYEKFQEESDPVKDLGIGFVEKVYRALKQIIEDKSLFDYLDSTVIKRFGFGDGYLIGYMQFSIPDNAPYFKDTFTKVGLNDYLIFSNKDDGDTKYYVSFKVKPQYQEVFKKAVSKLENRNI